MEEKTMKEKLDTKTTQDLFKVDDCPACNGEGQIKIEKKYFDPNNITDYSDYYDDCDICEGSGSV